MFFSKSGLFFIITALLLGASLGAYQYRHDVIASLLVSHEPVVWERQNINTKVLKKTANIDAILALTPPVPQSSKQSWLEFIDTINTIQSGDQRRHTNLSPMLAWYAYIAKYSPETIYQLLNQRKLNSGIFAHLLGLGLLKNWQQHLNNTDELLLNNRIAVAHIAINEGLENARLQVEAAFFKQANSSNKTAGIDGKDFLVNLEIIRFILSGLDAQKQKVVVTLLLNGTLKYDSRSVNRIAPYIEDKATLLAMLQRFPHSSKSMSSYLQDGALWGGQDYLMTMIEDAHNNDGQPTNFYCSVCGLALASDGLLGQALLNENAINTQWADGQWLITAVKEPLQ